MRDTWWQRKTAGYMVAGFFSVDKGIEYKKVASIPSFSCIFASNGYCTAKCPPNTRDLEKHCVLACNFVPKYPPA